MNRKMMSPEVFGHSLAPTVVGDENDHLISVVSCASAKENEDILRSVVISFMGYVRLDLFLRHWCTLAVPGKIF